MGKIVSFFIIFLIVMIYPVYVLKNQKAVKNAGTIQNISIITIYNGIFNIYDVNLSKKGFFKQLNIYKNYYLSDDLNVTDVIKKDNYFAKKAKYQKPYLYADYFIYKTGNYQLHSLKARYNTITKNFSGDIFDLKGANYKARGKSFLVDNKKDIKAAYPVFDIKVKK